MQSLRADYWELTQRSWMTIANYACGADAIDTDNVGMQNSCIRNGLGPGFHLLFIVALLILLMLRNRSRPMTPSSCFEWTCFVSASGLGVLTLGIATWSFFHEPLLPSLFLLTQGAAWLCLAFTVTVFKLPEYANFVRVWWAVSFILGTYIAILNVIDNKQMTVSMVLSLASWVVYTLLLCASFTGKQKDFRSEEEPLLARSEENVTPFATAGVFSRVSFWWLNPLLSAGYRSPLEQEDIPRLCEADSAEENLVKFAQALRQQESQFSVFWALAACYWRPMAYNGVFALGKSITVSMGPVVLKTFIEYTGGKRAFKYEGIVLVAALFAAKALESVCQRQWYFGSRRVGLQVRSALMAFIYRRISALQMQVTHELVNFVICQ